MVTHQLNQMNFDQMKPAKKQCSRYINAQTELNMKSRNIVHQTLETFDRPPNKQNSSSDIDVLRVNTIISIEF